MGDQLNRRAALGITAAGAVVIAIAIWLGGWSKATWSGVLGNAGVSIGLVAGVVLLERRLVNRVVQRTEQVVSERVEEGTRDLRDRLLRLEQLDEAQEEAIRRQAEQEDRVLTDFDEKPLDVEAVGRLLVAAHDERLFDDEQQGFAFRTSAHPKSHLLYVMALKTADSVPFLWLDYQRFLFQGDTIPIDGTPIPVPRGTGSTIMWHNEGADEVAAQLAAGIRRDNLPQFDFSLQYAFKQLAQSVEVMRTARRVGDDDPRRLRGRLQLLINRSWVMTTFGLESVGTTEAYEARYGRPGVRSGSVANVFSTSLDIEPELLDRNDIEWQEALAWVRDRSGWSINPEPERRRSAPPAW